MRFVFFYFVGDKVPFAKRGKYGVVKGDATRHFAVCGILLVGKVLWLIFDRISMLTLN